MSHVLRLSEDQLAAINKRNHARKIDRLGRETEPLPDPPKRATGRPKGRKLKVSEREVLRACSAILEANSKVCLWWRQNTGSTKIGERYVKFSFRGASDLMAVLEGGRFAAIECKAPGKRPSSHQTAFLANVKRAGGAAICVDNPATLYQWLVAL